MKNLLNRLAMAASLMIAAMSSATAGTTLTAVEQADMVTAHNTWRSEVGSPNLKWSAKLADTAQAWADTLKTSQACKMVHSHAAGVGENLYWASPLTYSKSEGKYLCSHCTYTAPGDTVCPKCHKPSWRSIGIGVEQLQVELKKLFPLAKIIAFERESKKSSNMSSSKANSNMSFPNILILSFPRKRES